nr:uncharacterized protein LOC111421552 isoform X1 [Onthophagus taurus]XP_022910497.1 uncharacterized protein LOC111421552 isoform X1 [Onthophagus taurus]
MLRFLLLILLPSLIFSKRNCGGVFTAKRGILQTPDFPGKFQTPIECEWIIKSDFENASIIVYLTQMYLYEGLTFTEYAQYDRRLPGNKIEEMPSGEDIFQVKYVRSYKNALVINLKLTSLDNVNLRVQNGFMDVYGFNITYEISDAIREDHCTVMDCQLNGYCYDYRTHFGCDCFEGYTGTHCLEGRKSACYKNSKPLCKNGATCRHIGDNGVMCHCPPGFQGRFCEETALDVRNEDEKDLCVSKSNVKGGCHCAEVDKLQEFKNDLQVFTVTSRFKDLPDAKEKNLREYISNEIINQLAHLHVKHVHVMNFEMNGPEVDVTVRFYGPKTEELRITELTNEWSTSARIGKAHIVDRDVQFYHQPIILSISDIAINKHGEIHEGDQFVLSCKVQASPNKSIRWYKDSLLVNVSRTIHRWSTVQKLDSTSQFHLAMLGIDAATLDDSGRYTCVAEDYGVRQCLSKNIRITAKPEVSLEPMSLTVAKGQRFAVECSSDAKGQTSYSWAKNGELLPSRTRKEYYETLYLTGSLLRVNGLNKSSNYSCLVQKGTVRREKNIYVVVIDPTVINLCKMDNSSGVLWTDTAPGYENLRQCPLGYQGLSKRSCVMKDNHFPAWDIPDMSQCISTTMTGIIKRFRYLRLGYEATTLNQTVTETLDYVKRTSLLEGEGVVIVNLLNDIANYIHRLNYSEDIESIATAAILVINSVLEQPKSLINEKQVTLLQTALKNILISCKPFLPPTEVFNARDENLIASSYPINQLTNFTSNLSGFGTNVSFRLKHIEYDKQYLSSTSSVIYNNLYTFLPTKSVLRINGTEINYAISSDIAALWYIDQSVNDFELILDFQLKSNDVSYNFTCVHSMFAPYHNFWSTDKCKTINLNSTCIRCICNTFGTFTVIGIEYNKPNSNARYIPNRIIVIVGCAISLLSAIFTTTLLLFHWLYRRSSITFIKMQCSASTIGSMSIFILGFTSDLGEGAYLYTQAFLQVFLLIGISTQLSLLLIIYADLLQLNKRRNNIKTTSICVVTGPALITVFGNYLSHISMNLKTISWWVIIGTTSFCVFTISFSILMVSYHMLYFLIAKHIRNNDNINISKKRVVLFNRSMYIFYGESFVILTSILYINLNENVVYHLLFATASILLATALLFCYILKSDDILEQYFLKRISEGEASKKNTSLNSSEIIERIETEEITNRNEDLTKNFIATTDIQNIIKSTKAPDILNSDNRAKLDLVSSSARNSDKLKKKVQKRTCNCCVKEKKSNVVQKSQPGCSKKISKDDNKINECKDTEIVNVNEVKEEVVENDGKIEQKPGNMDEVMISISEDLDYLLNRSVEIK